MAAAPRGRNEVLDPLAGQHQSDLVVVANRRESEHRAQLGGQLALLDPRGAEPHRARHVDHQQDRQLTLLDEALHVGFAEPRGHVPVDRPHLVARQIGAHLLELDAASLEHALASAREQVLDQVAAADLEAADLAQDFRGVHQGTRTLSRIRRPTSSPSTPSASASYET